MYALPSGRWRPATPWATAGAVVPLLSGCEGSLPSLGGWLFITSALLVSATLAYILGRQRERRRCQAGLHQARSAWRSLQQLQGGWTWETDGHHRLVAWRAPGRVAGHECPLFVADPAAAPKGGAAATLAAQLQSQTSFAGLRLQLATPFEGSRAWLASGVAQHDHAGRFVGHIGHAEPLDLPDARHAAAAAMPALLAAVPAPLLLAHRRPEGWELSERNALAQARWHDLLPGLTPPQRMADDWLGQLPGVPEALVAATASDTSLRPDAVVDTQGWRLVAFGPLADGGTGLLLGGPAADASGPDPSPAPAAGAPLPSPPGETQESDAFSFTVSHDLRAPIRVVEGFTRIVKEDYGHLLDRVGNDHLDRVLGAAARMNLMIDAMLTLARLSRQPLTRQPVNLSQLAQFVVDDLRRAAPDRGAEVDIEPGLVAQGDPTLLRLVLENLLANAWKYSAKVPRAQISLRSVPHGQGRALVVRDNGAGFDMRSADRLFGLFQRLHSASEFAGTGVGLASVRRIVQRHGGQIWAEAEVGRGAAFYFTLAA